MTRNRSAKPLAAAIGLVLLCAIPGLALDQSTPSRGALAPKAASAAAQAQDSRDPQNDFAGLNFTAEQKAEIDKIHRDIESRKAVVMKTTSLNEDQKSAMLSGYTRIESGEIFKVLSPEQQKQVRAKVNARRMADQAAKKQQLSERK
jgi:hypothetical protein